MAAGIAHEINQPLTAITTYANICQRWVNAGNTDHPKLPATLDEISEQARQASAIIEGMRNLVERRSARRELCDLNVLAQQTLRLSEADARRCRVALQTSLADTTLPIVATSFYHPRSAPAACRRGGRPDTGYFADPRQ